MSVEVDLQLYWTSVRPFPYHSEGYVGKKKQENKKEAYVTNETFNNLCELSLFSIAIR